MKLELKHITPYLPYGIKVTYVQCLFGGEKIVKHYSQSIDRIFMDYGFIQLHTEPYSKQDLLNSYLLELRPLSDLTKEIEHNGEKFIPESYFLNDIEIDWFDGNIWVNYLFQGEITDLDLIPYGMMIKLFEWHFDVFGLIEQGLAIDINTLKQ